MNKLATTAACILLLAPHAALAQKTEKTVEVRVYDASDVIWMGFETIADSVIANAEIEQPIRGLYLVEATADDHERLRDALTRVRELLAERIAVTFALYSAPRDGAPSVGGPASTELLSSRALRRIDAVVPRRMLITTESTESVGYIADVTPIVATGSSAYDPTVDEASSGLEITFSVGSIHDDGSLVTVHANYATSSVRTAFAESTIPVQLDLVSERQRELVSAVRVGDRPTVAAIADDPDAEERAIVLVVTLRDAP